MTTQHPGAGSQPPRPRTDAFLRGLARLVLSVFFRDVVVIGADRFPAGGPVIVVSNHLNSLIDGVALTAALPRMPRMLAASIIWDNAPLRPLLAAAGVIPVFRLQDVGPGNTRHRDTFEQTWELLAGGGVLSLFPEGASHNEPHLLPMKSGAARIALETGKQRGPLDIRIVPVGLFYEAKTVFRSRALVEIGDQLDIGPDLDRYRDGDAAARQQSVR
ncbi:lysophospholipid acyltransferase family protein [Seohaeicola saemankumensis]|nr:lysophospholipid acyltransferase family protein [Seohaeicola saemankumensis]MCA0872306.1 lysophospholipid acyltransferase family protein [Seohaeicola saemankumensis]